MLLQVLQYYYRGVASWDWFYPFHYAPMAQDMRRLDGIDGEHNTAMGLAEIDYSAASAALQ